MASSPESKGGITSGVGLLGQSAIRVLPASKDVRLKSWGLTKQEKLMARSRTVSRVREAPRS
jgi:hypothetical protein